MSSLQYAKQCLLARLPQAGSAALAHPGDGERECPRRSATRGRGDVVVHDGIPLSGTWFRLERFTPFFWLTSSRKELL